MLKQLYTKLQLEMESRLSTLTSLYERYESPQLLHHARVPPHPVELNCGGAAQLLESGWYNNFSAPESSHNFQTPTHQHKQYVKEVTITPQLKSLLRVSDHVMVIEALPHGSDKVSEYMDGIWFSHGRFYPHTLDMLSCKTGHNQHMMSIKMAEVYAQDKLHTSEQ